MRRVILFLTPGIDQLEPAQGQLLRPQIEVSTMTALNEDDILKLIHLQTVLQTVLLLLRAFFFFPTLQHCNINASGKMTPNDRLHRKTRWMKPF